MQGVIAGRAERSRAMLQTLEQDTTGRCKVIELNAVVRCRALEQDPLGRNRALEQKR